MPGDFDIAGLAFLGIGDECAGSRFYSGFFAPAVLHSGLLSLVRVMGSKIMIDMEWGKAVDTTANTSYKLSLVNSL